MDTDLLKAILQSMPLAIIIISLIFFKDIKRLLKSISIVSITIAGVELQLNKHDIKTTANFLLAAMTESLKKKEWETFSIILSSIKDPNKNTVFGILSWKLNRGPKGTPLDEETTDRLKILRALRGFGLIIPEDKKKWKSESKIIVTDFGKYVASHHELKKLIHTKS